MLEPQLVETLNEVWERTDWGWSVNIEYGKGGFALSRSWKRTEISQEKLREIVRKTLETGLFAEVYLEEVNQGESQKPLRIHLDQGEMVAGEIEWADYELR